MRLFSNKDLEPDTPLVLNVNPYFLFEDDPDSKNQIQRASSLTFQSLKFAASLKNKQTKPDDFKGTTLCMDQYRSLFGTCRIPKRQGEKDVMKKYSKSEHVAVLYRNQFYYFRALWPKQEGEVKVALSEEDIREALENIVKDGKKRDWTESTESAIGVLTTLSRHQWALAREELIDHSEGNKSALGVIDSALFVLVLDDYEPGDINDKAANMLHGKHIMKEYTVRNTQQLHQTGTCCNRWYDKLQLIVCSDGSAGINFEHSAIDGHTALRFASDIFAETVVTFAKSITKSIYTQSCPLPSMIEAKVLRAATINDGSQPDTRPKKIIFDISKEISDKIYYAETSLGDTIQANDTHILEFDKFGKSFIVQNKLSPDSLVQMSILLGYYRLYGKLVSAYEPVLTKQFFHGRTEAMRSTTSKVAHLCNIWTSSSTTKEEKLHALQESTKYHSKLVKEASDGKGVDRHLYALQCMAKKKGMAKPEFFKSEAWQALNHTILSTSNCGNPALRLFGFGPVVSDGYGIGYIIKDSKLQYSISSKNRQTKRFAHAIRYTLKEIGDILKKQSSLRSPSLVCHADDSKDNVSTTKMEERKVHWNLDYLMCGSISSGSNYISEPCLTKEPLIEKSSEERYSLSKRKSGRKSSRVKVVPNCEGSSVRIYL